LRYDIDCHRRHTASQPATQLLYNDELLLLLLLDTKAFRSTSD
jgi:hypothetical protein